MVMNERVCRMTSTIRMMVITMIIHFRPNFCCVYIIIGRRGSYDDGNKFVNEALLSGMPDVDDSKFTRVDSSMYRKRKLMNGH